MDHPQAFLVPAEIATTAGIEQERGAKLGGLAVVSTGLDRDSIRLVQEFGDGPTFPDFGSRAARMFEQEMIESGAFDLVGLGLAGEAAVAEDEFQGFAGVAEVELGAEL